MAFIKDLIFLFLCHLLVNRIDSKCPKSFRCRHLGRLQFPLSNDPKCGLLVVNGCDSPSLTLHTSAEGYWFNFLQNRSANEFLLSDPQLQKKLIDTSCSLKNLSLSQSPSISFTLITPNLTLFKCSNQTFSEGIQYYFESYHRVDCPTPPSIPSSTVFYRNPTANSDPHTDERRVPSACSLIQLPIKSNQGPTQLFNTLTSEFILEWSVSEACYECYYEGGQCLTDNMNEFYCQKGNRRLKKIFLIGGVTAFISTSIVMFLFIWRKYTPRRLFGFQKAKPGNEKDIELFLKINGNHAPKRYSYSEIKKMTKSFSENLGKGGYGSVYKGKLPDGRLVAVKILNESKGNGEEFMNEVASISRTSHINIVTLYGFCFKGSKRALIYEFMTNGSLDKFIQNTPSSVVVGVLGWQKLSEIALGIARGLEYLHQGCNTRILHFDIKPHNILLDEDFNPRISDFGLAKLCPNRSSIVSMLVARGTIGYIAPEVFCRNFGEVSHKSDVYSYGMMVLEIAGVKKTIDPGDVNCSSETYFPHYVYKQLEMDGERDDGIMVEDERQLAWRKLIIVGLWCIQTDPKDRPSMTKVVEMLEGQLESLRVPPKPYLSSHPTSAPQFSFSESV